MNMTFSFALLAMTLIASGSIAGVAEEQMPMGGQSLMHPQLPAHTQVGTKTTMPMGQRGPKQSGTKSGGMPQMINMKMCPMTTQELKAEFKDADKNKDGYADFNELVIHEGGDRGRAKLHFDDADRNKDQKVTVAEWIRHHKESPLHNSKVGTK